ncbi:MAG: hypothetical protein FJ087_23570, partial [Deltaproteobacteria bacterium]|nr:hypothetical protein [Deltaproteobacteria bacterium]
MNGKHEHLTYLASPYSDRDPDVPEGRYRAACAVAAIPCARGELVFSPIAHGHGIAPSGLLPVSWAYWERLPTDSPLELHVAVRDEEPALLPEGVAPFRLVEHLLDDRGHVVNDAGPHP